MYIYRYTEMQNQRNQIFSFLGSVPLNDPASPEDLAEKVDIIRKR